ncbi:hypothetical protein PRIPAC_95301 [Pristionchus pacificus]|uniref:G protein-coupled receptor n=1 Tax=Pristionchus pacificus TaxID=54126 RepID=A0A2A6D2A2_PRIPA|nr:hypothetical protein PRIPAC_95301 [Pristionchus pacificus]|eukprot:PDM84528.1 G protein-coupled receptor [Pristionchus pacificus]
MTDASYAWIYEDPIHSYFSFFTTAVSVCSNGLLLFILYTTKIGPYVYLLAVFAVCDIFTSCAHSAFQPIVHMTYGGFYFFPRHGKIVIAGKSFDSIFTLIFIATYYQTFLVLAYHFVYRYKIVSRGITTSCTNNWKRLHWAFLGVLINILYIFGMILISSRFTPSEETREIAPIEIEEIYGIDLRDSNRGFTVLAVRVFYAL